MADVQRKTLFLLTEYGEGKEKNTRWTRVGAGFVNRDGSVNVRFDAGMVGQHGLTYQLRDPKPGEDDAGGAQMGGVLDTDGGKRK